MPDLRVGLESPSEKSCIIIEPATTRIIPSRWADFSVRPACSDASLHLRPTLTGFQRACRRKSQHDTNRLTRSLRPATRIRPVALTNMTIMTSIPGASEEEVVFAVFL